MLKIKDNIELKELEKYGFEYYPLVYIKEIERYDKYLGENIAKKVCVDEKTKEISISTNLFDVDADIELDTLYDLIKADLVEKVDEE